MFGEMIVENGGIHEGHMEERHRVVVRTTVRYQTTHL